MRRRTSVILGAVLTVIGLVALSVTSVAYINVIINNPPSANDTYVNDSFSVDSTTIENLTFNVDQIDRFNLYQSTDNTIHAAYTLQKVNYQFQQTADALTLNNGHFLADGNFSSTASIYHIQQLDLYLPASFSGSLVINTYAVDLQADNIQFSTKANLIINAAKVNINWTKNHLNVIKINAMNLNGTIDSCQTLIINSMANDLVYTASQASANATITINSMSTNLAVIAQDLQASVTFDGMSNQLNGQGQNISRMGSMSYSSSIPSSNRLNIMLKGMDNNLSLQ